MTAFKGSDGFGNADADRVDALSAVISAIMSSAARACHESNKSGSDNSLRCDSLLPAVLSRLCSAERRVDDGSSGSSIGDVELEPMSLVHRLRCFLLLSDEEYLSAEAHVNLANA